MSKKPVTTDVFEADPVAPSPANRARATKLRLKSRAGDELSDDDARWLHDYDEQRAQVSNSSAGASRSRKESYQVEEHEAAGTGDAAAAAAAGAMVKEEGRRLDSMLGVSMNAMSRAFDMSMRMCEQMAARNHQLERAHVSMMEAYRSHFLGRVEAEAELEVLRRAEDGDKDGLSKFAEMLLPFLLPALTGREGEPAATDAKSGPAGK